jgi:hypothetical protein
MSKPRLFTALVLTLALGLGCSKKSSCQPLVEISGNHGHSLAMPDDAADKGGDHVYALKGGSHQHAVGVRDAELKKLKAGESVELRSTSVNSHLHALKVTCR